MSVKPYGVSSRARKRLALSELRRIKRALDRFSFYVEEAYPNLAATLGDRSHDMSETIRNADTALAHLPGWISYRVNTGADPYEDTFVPHPPKDT